MQLDEAAVRARGTHAGLTIYERNMDRLAGPDGTRQGGAASPATPDPAVRPAGLGSRSERHDDLHRVRRPPRAGDLVIEDSRPPDDEPPNPSPQPVDVADRRVPGEVLHDAELPPLGSLHGRAVLVHPVLRDDHLRRGIRRDHGGHAAARAQEAARNGGGGAVRAVSPSAAWCGGCWSAATSASPPRTDSVLATLKILDLNDMTTMMLLSILIGAGHVILSNLPSVPGGQRSSPRGLAPVGWIVAISGAAALAGWHGGPCTDRLGLGGPGRRDSAWCSCSPGAGGERPAFLRKRRRRAHGADPVSPAPSATSSATCGCSRSGSPAPRWRSPSTISPRIGSRPATGRIRHPRSRSLILVVGHTLNFVLAIVSGFVHGLRLNLIEFFKWSVFDEEGRPSKRSARRRRNS